MTPPAESLASSRAQDVAEVATVGRADGGRRRGGGPAAGGGQGFRKEAEEAEQALDCLVLVGQRHRWNAHVDQQRLRWRGRGTVASPSRGRRTRRGC